MLQAKFSLLTDHVEFLEQFQTLGYADKSSLVRAALDQFRKQLAQKRLMKSADLYAEVYGQDEELQKLTEQAIQQWPE